MVLLYVEIVDIDEREADEGDGEKMEIEGDLPTGQEEEQGYYGEGRIGETSQFM